MVWFATLWFLSGRPLGGTQITPSDYPIDKVFHFGYFFGGGGLLSAAALSTKTLVPSLEHDAPDLVVLILSAVGSLDEWHQSWYPFRSGNDAGDLTADIFGALAGTLLFSAKCSLGAFSHDNLRRSAKKSGFSSPAFSTLSTANMIFLTTAIDYPNGSPHIGHAYEKVLTDVLARYHRFAEKMSTS